MRVVPLILFLVFASPAWADRDIRYDTFDDWKRLGYVRQVEDTSDTSMRFIAECAQADYATNLVKYLMRNGWLVDKNQNLDGMSQVSTDWRQKSVGGFTSFASGIDAARLKLVFTSQALRPNLTQIDAQMMVEVAEDEGEWRVLNDRSSRNALRSLVAQTLLRPIYGDHYEVNTMIRLYLTGDAEMPTREQFLKQYVTSPVDSAQD